MLCQAECGVTDSREVVEGRPQDYEQRPEAERVYKEVYVGRWEERAEELFESELKRRLVLKASTCIILGLYYYRRVRVGLGLLLINLEV